MSDYIYGSSLRAAKSKANYLFEGDFRRKPSQNLSGASRSLARGELLQQAAEQRQNREDIRRREQGALKIQSVWRGHRCREFLRSQMRHHFDSTLTNLQRTRSNQKKLDDAIFWSQVKEFVVHYHSGVDVNRFRELIDLMMRQQDVIIQGKISSIGPKAWSYRMIGLFKMCLDLIQKSFTPTDPLLLRFIERFTRPKEVLDEHESSIVWQSLIKSKLFAVLRHSAHVTNKQAATEGTTFENQSSRLIVEIVRRSLDIETSQIEKVAPARYLFSEFLRGPLDIALDKFYLPEIMRSKPRCLQARSIVADYAQCLGPFDGSHRCISSRSNLKSLEDYENAVWLCHSFVRIMYSQIDQLSEPEKVLYLNVIAILIEPAQHITSLSLLEAHSDDYQEEDETDNIVSPPLTDKIGQYHGEINKVITGFINLINDSSHINGLKSIIFNCELRPQIQGLIVSICNLMLAHEPLAIFNCRLLYTVAFSGDFSRSLWKSVITSCNKSLYSSTTPIYMQVSRGVNVSNDSWNLILPSLKLFCSLYSYILPTLDDDDIYTSEKQDQFPNDSETLTGEKDSLISRAQDHSTHNSFFIDKELANISAVLRDMCVGLIEILYQDNKHSQSKQVIGNEGGALAERNRLLSFETKLCFRALVRLVCQLHARDSRKQFCPDGHWICPAVAIPANKAIDFQLVSSQQGRLLTKMTKENKTANDRMPISPMEIKTVLILQEIPFVISFHDRVRIFHQLLLKEKQIHHSEGYHFGLPGTAISVQIRRNYLYEDAFERLSFENEPNLKKPLKVALVNAVGADEAGIDGGGISKEFICELLKAGFDPMRGFFKSTREQLLYPNPSANVLFLTLPEGFEIHYEFLGRMLGKAIFEKIMVELPLARFFLAKLLGRKNSSDVDIHNLESLDPVLYKNLVYLKNYKGDVADLNLDFTISNNELDEHEVIELKPNGSKIPVTRENRIEYVHLVADYRLNKQIRAQCAAFKRGLAQLIDLDWLRMFDSRELQILISGAPASIDTADWRRNTIYANGYSDDSEAINIFWRVVQEFDENQKRKLLRFTTSCSLAPLFGFKDLVPKFTIAPSEGTRLPTAATCMNLLKLPECEDEMTMKSKLLYALESNSGFDLS